MLATLSQRYPSFAVYAQKRVMILLLLGFSAGLPLVLVFGTLSFWLREAGVDRTTIGYFSWIAAIYGFKWVWSPIIDRTQIPVLAKLMGRRRSWMLTAQIALIVSLLGMSTSDPANQIEQLAWFTLAVAFFSATQDIVVDAFRIESAPESVQGAMAAAYQAGYRSAMIVAGAGALTFAAWLSPADDTYLLSAWQGAYVGMAVLAGVGVITTLIAKEPEIADAKIGEREQQTLNDFARRMPYARARFSAWLYHSVAMPFKDFFSRFGKDAILILMLISCYRISDIVMGIMANVFYVDMGFAKQEIAAVSKVYGLIMTLVGGVAGGALLMRYGTMKILYLGAALVAITNLLFAVQAEVGYNMALLTFNISVDNFSAGIATAAFIAYLSSLTSAGYTATQYALLSSIMLLFPKFVAGFSGMVVDAVGYTWFFVAAAAIGFPVLTLVRLVDKARRES
ncbi:AmpG family muropeptide MFS transporter [Paraferrimonas sedimenticola]|uniref:MFS transporter n=1 Tax=Paraferrimonas sedimenticola TaxID=375674 RepID=A0AA37RXG3_9GAMM|nr:MFS transporter [Paraferrimonas sedimenticola]GLP96803.1 MFS transporter [Paraferrimonas sedimenticola]